MKKFHATVGLALFLCGLSLTACGSGAGNSNSRTENGATENLSDNTNTAKTNVEELGLLVNVPYAAEDIVWKSESAQKRVLAVLLFSSADADKFVSEAEKLGEPMAVSIAAEQWFPGELTAQSEISGDGALKGTAYAANSFYQEPYTTGRITRIQGTDYFVLEISAK